MDTLAQSAPVAASRPAFQIRSYSDNPQDLPVIGNTGPIRPVRLHPYNVRTRSTDNLAKTAVHFFLDDYQIDVAWSRPGQALPCVQQFQAAVTPDFSIWAHWPLAAQQWNTYRNRWVGAYWMSQGVTVIPSVSWAAKESFRFAFAGIRWGSTVAISTIGVKSTQARVNFLTGFLALIERVNPRLILCYGRMPFESVIETIEYPPYWDESKGNA